MSQESLPFSTSKKPFWHSESGREILTLLLLALIALIPRLYRIESAPPGLNGDELFNAIDALSLGPGHWQVFFEGNYGREALFLYLMAVPLKLFGESIWAIRLPAVILGTGVVLLAYGVGRTAFNRRIGFVTGLIIAVSLWPVMQSRWGLRAVSLTFFTVLTVLLYLLALRRSGRAAGIWIAAGITLGLTLYTYIPARVFPFVILVWFAWIGFTDRTLFQRIWPRLLLSLLVALVIFAPFGIYMVRYPEKVNQRINALAGANALEKALDGDPAPLIKNTAAVSLSFSFKGDNASRYHLDGRPVFDPLTSIFFYVGLVATIWLSFKRREPERRSNYGLLLIWLPAMMAPSLLTGLNTSFLRGAGAIVPIYMMVAIGLDVIYLWLARRWPRKKGLWQTTFATLVAAGATLTLVATWQGYFNQWVNDEQVRLVYRSGLAEIGHYIAKNPPEDGGELFIAYDYVAENTPREFTYYYDGEVTWFNSADAFGWRPNGQPAWIFVSEQRPVHEKVLAKLQDLQQGEIVSFGNGDPAFTLYHLDPGDIDWAPSHHTLVEFANGPTLIGFDMPETLERGQNALVTLHWLVPEGVQGLVNRLTYAQVFLEDESGNVWQQAETLLGYPEAGWRAGDRFVTLIDLEIPQGMPPGPAYFRYGLRDWQGTPFSIVNKDVSRSGPFLVRSQIATDITLAPDAIVFDNQLALQGFAMSTRLAPGLPTDISLDWLALEEPADDYRIQFQIADGPDGETVVTQTDAIWPDVYPPSSWQKGEQVTSFHRLRIPQEMPEIDDPWLRVELLPSTASLPLSIVQGDNALAQLTIERREHQFEVPDISQPLEAQFGEQIKLLGYDLGTATVAPGGQLQATLYWQAIETPADGYTVFNHLVDVDGLIRGQFDGPPSGDAWYTGSWLPGEIIVDQRTIPVDDDAPAGTYTLYVGLYTADDGQRLPATLDGEVQVEDRLPLSAIAVESSP